MNLFFAIECALFLVLAVLFAQAVLEERKRGMLDMLGIVGWVTALLFFFFLGYMAFKVPA